MSRGPLVSIIALNFNGLEVTQNLLQTVFKSSYLNIEVIVVDNGSYEDPTAILEGLFPKVKVRRTGRNLGYAGGINFGRSFAKGKYLFVVNNDTLFTDELISRLVDTMQQVPNVGIVSPLIVFNDSKRIQYGGYSKIHPITGRNHVIDEGKIEDDPSIDSATTVYAHGAAVMILADVFDQLNGFPEVYFLYYEEIEFSHQAQKAGYVVYVNKEATIYHLASYSTGKSSELQTYYLTRNRILFMERNMDFLHFTGFVLFFLCFTCPKTIFRYLMQGRFGHLKSFFKAIFWHLATSRKIKLA